MKKHLSFLFLLLAMAAPATAQVDFKVGLRFGATLSRFRATNWHATIPDSSRYVFGGQAFNGSFSGLRADETRSMGQVRGTLGVVFRIGIGKFAIQPELLFSGLGGRDEREVTSTSFLASNTDSLNYVFHNGGGPTLTPGSNVGVGETLRVRYENVYLQIPILARYRPLNVDGVSPYVVFGPVIDMRLFSLQWNERVVADHANNTYRMENKGTNFNEMGTNVKLTNVGASLAMGAGVDFPFGFEIEIRYNLGLSAFATFRDPNALGTTYFRLKQGAWFFTLSKTFGK